MPNWSCDDDFDDGPANTRGPSSYVQSDWAVVAENAKFVCLALQAHGFRASYVPSDILPAVVVYDRAHDVLLELVRLRSRDGKIHTWRLQRVLNRYSRQHLESSYLMGGDDALKALVDSVNA